MRSSKAYKATIKAKTEPATRPERVNTFVVSTTEAAAPVADVEEAEEAPVSEAATAWIPKVVPVMTEVAPLVTTVVVTVAGRGLLVVVEQPDQVPVQELNGPHPAVHVVLA